MNALEFEKEVRELRRRQRAFFHYRKDDPSREKALQHMREQEELLRNVIEPVMAIRTSKESHGEREQFFLLVAEMMKKQREWARQGGGSWYMNPARDAEHTVDKWLAKWDEQKAEEKRRAMEEERKKQLELF
jgi:hypothetical protein